jgi:hypothetical protein
VHKILLLDSPFYPVQFNINKNVIICFTWYKSFGDQVTEKQMRREYVVVHICEKANGYGVLVENLLGRYRCKREDNI